MHQLANGASVSVGLVGSDGPPLSTETVGRAPSILEPAPVALKSFEVILAERQAAEQVQPAETEETAETIEKVETVEEAPVAAEQRRLVVRLLGGEEIELGVFDVRADAVAAAQELVAAFTSAESSGEWPEVDGRFLRPASVASIDVLLQD